MKFLLKEVNEHGGKLRKRIDLLKTNMGGVQRLDQKVHAAPTPKGKDIGHRESGQTRR